MNTLRPFDPSAGSLRQAQGKQAQGKQAQGKQAPFDKLRIEDRASKLPSTCSLRSYSGHRQGQRQDRRIVFFPSRERERAGNASKHRAF